MWIFKEGSSFFIVPPPDPTISSWFMSDSCWKYKLLIHVIKLERCKCTLVSIFYKVELVDININKLDKITGTTFFFFWIFFLEIYLPCVLKKVYKLCPINFIFLLHLLIRQICCLKEQWEERENEIVIKRGHENVLARKQFGKREEKFRFQTFLYFFSSLEIWNSKI